jgi:hypothetical protein
MRKPLLALAIPALFSMILQGRAGGAEGDVAPKPIETSSQVPVTFTGGHETDPRDGGRPVILIAAALKVSPDVFRNVFKNVHPAGPAGNGPTDAEARSNKKVLLDGLGPYGVTDDRINQVSNYYRYASFRGQKLWRVTDAAATATVRDGVVTGFTITNPGSGYSSPPQVSVPGIPNLKAGVTLAFGEDFKTNGSIKEITLGDSGAVASTIASGAQAKAAGIEVKTEEGRPSARPGRPPGGGPVQRSLDQLRLSDEQMQKIEPLLRDYRAKEMQLRNEISEQLKQVLSPSQYEQFAAGLTQRPPPAAGGK